MNTRKKIIVSASFAIGLLAIGLFLWSPQARVDERLSMQDLVSLRLAARAHTLWPIIEIQADGDGHNMGNVTAGAKRSWVSGSGYYWYNFERTSYGGWRLSCWDPVTFMYPPSHVMLFVVFQIVEFVGVATLALLWCLRNESRWRVRTAVYSWAGFILFALLWSLLIPVHYVSDSFGNRSTGASFSYFGMIAVAAFVFGWSWPAAISYLERKRRADDHVA
jgi:hypothetical protein